MKKLYTFIDRVWGLISHTIFVRFEFDIPIESLRSLKQKGRIVFALSHGGMIEWLILSSWCRMQGMGAILVANRKSVLCFAKPLFFLQVLIKQKKFSDLYVSKEEGPRLLFCPSHERKKLFTPTPVENLLAELHDLGNPSSNRIEFYIVPVFIRWRKHIRAEGRQFSEMLLGLSSNPNIFGKLWYLLRKRRDSTVKGLTPFPLERKESSESPDKMDETEDFRVARSTRRKILVLIQQEMRVVLGPRYQSPTSVKETLMRDPEILKAVSELAIKTEINEKKALLKAYQYLTEIVANYTFRFVEVMVVFLTWLFTKVFDGLVTKPEELQAVREVMKTKPIVFVACHRSHLDYLVIPYVLFFEDMATPHIVAGVNLSFWPAGYLLRMGGAFFIRRSFRGDPLYAVCLKKYIGFLLKNRINIKFFIEGTRSRSGKMLPPAYGILKMVLETHHSQKLEDIALVPVSLCYDEVLEESSYTKELLGGKKETETATSLLKSRKLIKKNIGKVYVRFAPALSVKEILQSATETGLDPTLTLQKTAFQLCKNINDVTPITAKSLVSSILLTHRMMSVPLGEILRISHRMGQYGIHSGAALSTPIDDGFRRTIEQTIRKLQKDNLIVVGENIPRGYSCEGKRRIVLNFYKNNAIHFLVTPSIVFLAIFDTLKNMSRFPSGTSFYDEFIRSAVRLRNILKFEFFFSPTPVFVNELKACLTFFGGEKKWEEGSPEDWATMVSTYFNDPNEVSVYLALVGDVLENYLSTTRYLRGQEGTVFDKKTLLSKLLKHGESELEDGKILFPECISSQAYSNALMLFENLDLIKLNKVEDKVDIRIQGWNDETEVIVRQINEYIDIIKENPEILINPKLKKFPSPKNSNY